MRHYDVVFTTYSTLAREWQGKGRGAAIFMKNWHRVILDECEHCVESEEAAKIHTYCWIAHCIKDINSITAQAALALRADRRWAVTGTPVQNGLSDMFSLFRFIQVYPYSERCIVDQHIITPWTTGDREDAIQRLRKLLQYIMLRRPSSIISLPERTDKVISLTFDAQEREKYQQLAQATIHCLGDLLHSNSAPGGYKNAVTKINALRMACNLGCQRNNNFQNSLYPPNLSSRQSSVFAGAESGTETLECSESLAQIGICKACGMLFSSSNLVISEDIGDPRTQLWCSSCLLDLAEPVEDGSESGATSLENTPGQATIGRRQWSTKIRALLDNFRNQSSGTKWSVSSHPRILNRETKQANRSTDGGTLVSFSRLGHQPLTLPMQPFLKKESAAFDLTGKPLTSRGKAYFRISQTHMGQLCCSCPFNVELSGENYQVSLMWTRTDQY